MAFKLSSIFGTANKPTGQNFDQTYDKLKTETGITLLSRDQSDGSTLITAISPDKPPLNINFSTLRIDEAHTFFVSVCELLQSRAAAQESPAAIYALVERLFASYHRP